jgi:uncharacterized protein (DUF1501 family)
MENAGKGTDHGTANNMYLFGGMLKSKAVYNEGPDLTSLLENNLQYSLDFRSVYATILAQWFDNTDVRVIDYNNQLSGLL